MNAVEARHLTMRFGKFTAVDDVSLTVPPGEIFGFLGANGAGKTTTIRMLCGLLAPSGGQAFIHGIDLSKDPRAVKRLKGYMSQKLTLYDDLSVAENLEFTASLYKLPPEFLKRRTRDLFGFIGFDRPPETLVRDLPGGLKQQVSLAAAILHDPEIIFLDEPTAGVAPAARARFWELIRSLSGQGKTVFVTTHYMDEAEQCGRIALMASGRLIALDSPAGLKAFAFPNPLLELEGPAKETGWVEALKADPCVETMGTYGMRYHAAMRGGEACQNLMSRLPPLVKARVIAPSLEDVFLRLVESHSGGRP